MNNTIEKLVCDAVLQNPQTIEVKGKKYMMAPPTVATLIEVSKYISQIPEIKIDENGSVVTEVLASARDCAWLGDIAAILMLGFKNLVTEKEIEVRKLFGLVKYKKKVKVNNKEELAKEILGELSPEELSDLITSILRGFHVDFFFGILIFLKEINILKPTMATETTASGL